MANSALAKNFEFKMISEFGGYNSSRDKTNISSNFLVRGSQNVYKKLSGTIAVRQGQKRQGEVNTAHSAVSSEFVWNTSWGATLPLWIADNKLQVRYNDIWYTLLDNLSKTRYVFDKWYDATEAKDRVLFVKGDSDLQHWSGGVANVAPNGAILTVAINNGGTGYVVGDVLTILGGYATVTVTTVASGVITAVIVTDSGSGYSTSTNTALIGGTGLGATIDVVSVAAIASNTISKTNPSISFQQAGFATNIAGEKKVMIGGTEFTYTGGETTATLTGVTPDASGITGDAIILQSVITEANTPAAGYSNDFIKVINNQVYVGSYTSRLVYISSSTDFRNYVVPTPRSPGTPELLTLDGTGKGIGVRQGNAHIGFGSGEWAVVTFTDITVGNDLTQQTKVDVKPVAKLQAPYAHEFISTVGDSLVYLAQDQQVRTFGDFNNLFTPGYPSFSQEIATELMEQDFTGGALKCIGEFTYLTAPVTGQVYLYQVRQRVDSGGNVVAERLWHPPFIWNATRIDEIDGTIVAFSNANPQVYEVWDTGQWFDDSPSEEQLPYTCIMAMAYRGEERPQGMWTFDKNFTEGYITEGTPLNLTINYNYQGSLDTLTVPVNSVDRPAYLFSGSNPASLGDSSLGDEPLGMSLSSSVDPANTLSKFKVINSMNIQNCFEYQVIYSSEATNAQWEIERTATNAVVEKDQDATFIINKVRS